MNTLCPSLKTITIFAAADVDVMPVTASGKRWIENEAALFVAEEV